MISLGFASSATGASSTAFGGGDVVFGRLAVESVGELVDWELARGGVEFEPVECVCASFARLFV